MCAVQVKCYTSNLVGPKAHNTIYVNTVNCVVDVYIVLIMVNK